MGQNQADRDSAGLRHDMQVFESIESAADAVAEFLLEGFAHGETLLVAMRLAHWNLVSARLMSTPMVDITRAIGSGQLTVLDSNRALGRIMWNGMPSQALFGEVIGKLVAQLASRGDRVRVYGDMVDILAGEGNFPAAQELERFWNLLVLSQSVTLFCGYSAAHFDIGGSAAHELIARAHSHVRAHVLPAPSARRRDWQSPV